MQPTNPYSPPTTTPGAAAVAPVAWESFLPALDARLAHGCFRPCKRTVPELGAERCLRRRRFSLTKFGFVDTFVVAKRFDGPLAPQQFAAFSALAFRCGMANKIWLPRGFGGTAVVYPLAVVRHLTPELRDYVSQYAPKHWASFEFPAVLELSTGQLACFDRTPMWGGAYYRGFRNEVRKLYLGM
jgi:hypothetical protein